MQTNPYQQTQPRQRASSIGLVRVGESAFTYKQIAERLNCTVVQAQGKVRRIRGRKTHNQVTWERLGLAGPGDERRD
jgi:hypothetical protein